MPLDPDFVAQALYDERGLLIDEILEVDAEAGRVRARMPTHADLPLTNTQRADPPRHPRHVSGGLMVHMTGVIAYVHFYYVLGLRPADGWTGYGVRVHNARFHALAEPGDPIVLECAATRIRKLGNKISARYRFTFTQGDRLVYQGDQSALWLQVQSAA